MESHSKKEFFSSHVRSFLVNSGTYEYEDRSTIKGTHFVPIGIPTD
jgi:hypothetical protein